MQDLKKVTASPLFDHKLQKLSTPLKDSFPEEIERGGAEGIVEIEKHSPIATIGSILKWIIIGGISIGAVYVGYTAYQDLKNPIGSIFGTNKSPAQQLWCDIKNLQKGKPGQPGTPAPGACAFTQLQNEISSLFNLPHASGQCGTIHTGGGGSIHGSGGPQAGPFCQCCSWLNFIDTLFCGPGFGGSCPGNSSLCCPFVGGIFGCNCLFGGQCLSNCWWNNLGLGNSCGVGCWWCSLFGGPSSQPCPTQPSGNWWCGLFGSPGAGCFSNWWCSLACFGTGLTNLFCFSGNSCPSGFTGCQSWWCSLFGCSCPGGGASSSCFCPGYVCIYTCAGCVCPFFG